MSIRVPLLYDWRKREIARECRPEDLGLVAKMSFWHVHRGGVPQPQRGVATPAAAIR